MKLNSNSMSRHTKLVGIALICGLTVIGCSKKSDEDKKATQEEVNVDSEVSESGEMSDVSSDLNAVKCDDEAVLSQLTESLQSSVSLQSQNLFNNFANRANVSLNRIELSNAVDSILIDVADTTVIQEANADGMVTCKTSLSLTLPNKDVTRAVTVYETLEDGSLSDYLNTKNITLNNNMLVSNNFNYVVGMQNDQPVARLVGVPNISTAAADIIARSQFKLALDASRSTPVVNKPRPARIPSPPTVRTEPKPRPARPESQQEEINIVEDPLNNGVIEPEKPSIDKAPNPVTPTESVEEFEVPTDESIEMLIIEEEGTY